MPLCKDCLLHQPEKVDAFSQAAISWWLEWCKQLSSTTLCCFDQIPEKCLGINLERTKLECWAVHFEPFLEKYYAHFCFWPKKRLSKSYETLETAQSWTKSWLSVFITLFAKISVHLFLQNGNLEVSWLAPNMPEMRLRNFLTLLALKCFIVPKTIKMSCMMRAKKAISLAARGVIVAPVIRGFND